MPVPSRIILIWSGSIASIPAGFVLCDGNNGTPDLRNRFVVGAGDTYSVDDSGGNVNHNHSFTSDGHAHFLPIAAFIQSGTGFDRDTSSNFDTGTTNNASTLPPYYALAYIMKT